ncbi:sulfite reductase subunit A [Schlesneria paludicola]|uniref:sulfite reductase subunit A n=1 Tax=Schlesneria paludicola TaxID=360056 RepID=UPI00029AB737|nr:sulfite reductase subunit A [Schlesneria paludicola]
MTPTPRFVARKDLQRLIVELQTRDYHVIGPTIDQDAIVYDEVTSVEQLPQGWTDEQAPGHYRLKQRDDGAWFGYAVGPHCWKKYLFPPKATLLSAEKTEQGWAFIPHAADTTKYAFLGVRACELAAIQIQDRAFLEGPYQDPLYRERREQLLIIAVNCTQAATTCFCTSMKTGPNCQSGFDLALTEIEQGFLCDVGSTLGADILSACPTLLATSKQLEEGSTARQQAVDQITRQLDTSDLPGLLLSNLDHPHWKEVGDRCLSCTNCTMVCPTCFCSSVTEVRDLNMERVERERVWDSCFNPDFSYLGGTPVRNETAARYRQWLTHKLDSWHAQFGTSGCVGCGRCITWCPVGIDLTEEVVAIRKTPAP